MARWRSRNSRAFIIRWPNRIPAGRVTNEIVHEVDTFAIAGAVIPTDRAIDGVEQSGFCSASQKRQIGKALPYTWRIVLRPLNGAIGKIVFYDEQRDWVDAAYQARTKAYDLITDPKEEYPATGLRNTWVAAPAMNIVLGFEKSLKKYPPTIPSTPDPYRLPNN